MHFLVYDHTFDGFLSAVFHVYEYKLKAVRIMKQALFQPGMFQEAEEIFTDVEKAKRVWKRLEEILGKQSVQVLLLSFLSEEESVEIPLLEVIRMAFANPNQNVLQNYGNEHVVALQKLTKSVSRERHRMKAFVRFELLKDEIYAAKIDPDFDVLLLIKNHFKNRYQDQKWLIYDIRRNYGLFYDLEKVEVIQLDVEFSKSVRFQKEVLSEKEQKYQHLWQEYFDHTNIVERKNTKLHLQHVPKRYWKYLTEKRS